jgi:hypothetical protein
MRSASNSEWHPVAGVELVVPVPGVRARGERGELERGMPVQDRGGDRAAVAGGPDDCYPVSAHGVTA